MKAIFRITLAILFATTWSFTLDAQTFDLADAPNLWGSHNQVANISFDYKGVALRKGKNYFNTLGNANQGLSWDVLTNKVWANQMIYDRYGRTALQTLSAPVSGGLVFDPSFILNESNNPYTADDFDIGGSINDPSPVGNASPLRNYFSTANTENPYQDITEYPFVRTAFSKLNPGIAQKVLGGNKMDGEWKQAYSFSMDAGTELTASNAFGPGFNTNTRIIKTVTRDFHGKDVVVFVNSDGNTLAAARSGSEGGIPYTNEIYIGKQGYVDIHIPTGVTSFSIFNPSTVSSGTLKVYDLISETVVQNVTGTNTTVNLGDGFYRIAVSTPSEYRENAPGTIRVLHDVYYYDYNLSGYDESQRLIHNTQPLSQSMESAYLYNSLGQVLDVYGSEGVSSQFLHRKDGQVRFSQNSANSRRVTYTNYDSWGRPIESGVFTWTGAFQGLDPDGPAIAGMNKEHVRYTVYDIPDLGTGFDIPSCFFPFSEYKQTFVAGKISKTYTSDPETSTTWYSYDAQGRVTWIVQEIEGLNCYKTIDYTYSPATGKVVEVDFQRHDPNERFIHKYEYNRADRLVAVLTSRTGNDGDWVKQADYIYAETGELIRTVLAENLQGIDYVYNLNNQLKAINHPNLEPSKDPGGDGLPGSTVAADVFGYAIDYYNGDYARTGTPTPVAQQNTHGTDQYNGYIKGVRFNTSTSGSYFQGFNTYMYEYNKNNWMDRATFGTGSITADGSGGHSVNFSPNANDDYGVSNLAYDANGNILSLKRNGYTDWTGTNAMDDFQYQYEGNQLQGIADTGDNPDPNRYNDLKNQASNGQPNYTYNPMGQLYSDIAGRAIYEYTPSGLVSSISTFGDNPDPNQQFWLYSQNHQSTTPDELDQWTLSSGTKEINEEGTYGGIGTLPTCTTLDNLYDKSLELRMPDNATATRVFDVLNGVPQTLDLTLIVDQYKELVATGEPHEKPTGYTITLYDGVLGPAIPTILGTRSFNTALDYINDPDLPDTQECSGLYERTESFSFTPSENEVTLVIRKVTVSDELPIFIDNIFLSTGVVPLMDVSYNDRRQRVKKTVYNNGNTYTTYYVRDIMGTIIGIYSSTNTGSAAIREVPTYGIGRIGDYLFNSLLPEPSQPDGAYRYEIMDHLGNVRVVLSKAADGTPIMLSKADYYPFGMPMPNRTQEGSYRYAFQGQEKDTETEMEAFNLRFWNNKTGKWLTIDPARQFFSPYLGMGNNPVNAVDVDGGYIYLIAGSAWASREEIYKILETAIGRETLEYIANSPDFHIHIGPSPGSGGERGDSRHYGATLGGIDGVFSDRDRYLTEEDIANIHGEVRAAHLFPWIDGARVDKGYNWYVVLEGMGTSPPYGGVDVVIFHEIRAHVFANLFVGVKDENGNGRGDEDHFYFANTPDGHPVKSRPYPDAPLYQYLDQSQNAINNIFRINNSIFKVIDRAGTEKLFFRRTPIYRDGRKY